VFSSRERIKLMSVGGTDAVPGSPGQCTEDCSSDWRLGNYLLNESGSCRWYRSLGGKTCNCYGAGSHCSPGIAWPASNGQQLGLNIYLALLNSFHRMGIVNGEGNRSINVCSSLASLGIVLGLGVLHPSFRVGTIGCPVPC
jgi:hypothetical protein